ncbi:ribonuclease HIII [Leuconostoc sp. MS02]|uniref:Ribonuclease HIII n=1 Tax=Leuconostoc aquikimchii TaxID=3236804 RepID=A0ABV3S1A5_9LACO
MLTLFLIPILILCLIVYFFASLFTHAFGIIPRLILAIILVLLVSFIIKNFFAILGVLIVIMLAFWIRAKFINKTMTPPNKKTFDGHFEEVDKDK